MELPNNRDMYLIQYLVCRIAEYLDELCRKQGVNSTQRYHTSKV